MNNASYIRNRNNRCIEDDAPRNPSSKSPLNTEKKSKSLQGAIEKMKSTSRPKNDHDATNDKHNETNTTNTLFDDNVNTENVDQELSDILSMPSITLTNDEYFKWVKSQSCSFVTSVSPSTHAIATNPKNNNNTNFSSNTNLQENPTSELRNGINRSETMTTTHTLSSMHNIKDFKETEDTNDHNHDDRNNHPPIMIDYIFDPSIDLSQNSVSPLSFSNPILTNSNLSATEICLNSKMNQASSHKTSLFEISTSSNRASNNSIYNSKCNNDFTNTTNSLLQ